MISKINKRGLINTGRVLQTLYPNIKVRQVKIFFQSHHNYKQTSIKSLKTILIVSFDCEEINLILMLFSTAGFWDLLMNSCP